MPCPIIKGLIEDLFKQYFNSTVADHLAEQSLRKIHLPVTEHFQAARHPFPCILQRRKTGQDQSCLPSSDCWEAGADQPFLVLESKGVMPRLIFPSKSLQQEFETPNSPFTYPLTALLVAETHRPLGPGQWDANQLLPGKQEAMLVVGQS